MFVPQKKPVQLVKNMSEVPQKKRWDDRGMWGQEKIDGVYAFGLATPDDTRIFTRTGKQVHSLKHIEEQLAIAATMFQPAVYIFEVAVLGWPVNKINSRFSRKSEQFTEACAYIHDVIPLDDFIAGHCELPYRLRYAAADLIATRLKHFYCITVTDLQDEAAAMCMASNVIEDGGEGIVIKRVYGTWTAGKKNEMMMKIKREVSYDLEVTSIEAGQCDGKYAGTLGKLVCRWTDGRVVRISGMTDAQRDLWWLHPERIIGRIVKVDGMCLTPDGMIREPRFKEIRIDKDEADV